MENSVRKTGGGLETVKKTKSLDIQSLYKSGGGGSGKEACNNKGKSVSVGNGEEVKGKKKGKNRKDVSLSSFEPAGKKCKNILVESVLVSEGCDGAGMGLSQKVNGSDGGGLNNNLLNLVGNGNGLCIPKRQRGTVGRKRFANNWSAKSFGSSDSIDQSAKIKVDKKESLQNENTKHADGKTNSEEYHKEKMQWCDVSRTPESSRSKTKSKVEGSEDHLNDSLIKLEHNEGKESSNSERREIKLSNSSWGKDVSFKLKRKRGSDESKVNRRGMDLATVTSLQHDRSEGGHLIVNNGDASSSKRLNNYRKRKVPTSGRETVVHSVDDVIPNLDVLPEYDEENLEQNAARMLSSRFDPSCTGSSANGLSLLTSSASRVLRPRKQLKGKGFSRKRRHFYEILSSDLDAVWFLNRRIMIFWPLDESWYYGLVNDYDSERKLHHIKYDDRDEEWVSLQNERFKLLLLPSEVPSKTKIKESTIEACPDTESKNLNTEDDDSLGTYMEESEPIISWLRRSSIRVKSSVSGKKQKMSHLSSSVLSSDKSEVACGNTGMGLLESKTSNPCNSSTLPVGLIDDRNGDKSEPENSSRAKGGHLPIVYVRRRKKNAFLGNLVGSTSCTRIAHSFQSSEKADAFLGCSCSNHLIWSLNNSGLLELNLNLKESKELRFEVCVSLLPLLHDVLGANNTWLIHNLFLLRYGTIMSTWPTVQLEVLFVDNVAGLRFFLYEGCLKQAIAFVFLVMAVFCESDKEGLCIDFQVPVTSVRFRLSCIQDIRKHQTHVYYSFSKVKNSKWSYLDGKLQPHCLHFKRLSLPECTYDNIKMLEGGSLHLRTSSSSSEVLRKRSILGVSRKSHNLNSRWRSSRPSLKESTLPPFALSFTSVPTFFHKLHLKLLMESSITSITLQDHTSVCSLDCPVDFIPANGTLDVDLSQDCDPTIVIPDDHAPPARSTAICHSEFNGMSVEIPSCDRVDLDLEQGHGTPQVSDLAWNLSDGIVCSPNHMASRSMWVCNRLSPSTSSRGHLSHAWPPEGRTEFIPNGFGNGPRKPRTQVQYTMPFGGSDLNSKLKMIHTQNGISFKRIRRANANRILDGSSRGSRRNLELVACDANLLITQGDKGWRECGARVFLEVTEQNEWRLAVKLRGMTKYSHKVTHDLQPGSTNRFTHGMMWKGGKDWALEFPDRSQWILFKEMHEECHNRNIRAASLKNIPIPGVRLIEDFDDYEVEKPFHRTPKYFRQVETDMDMAMDPSRILYDMDSDDEEWIEKNEEILKTRDGECEMVFDELFEKTMDMFEKASYVQHCNHFTVDEMEEFEVGPTEVVKAIYDHWLQKRQRKGMALIRQLQPPLWEKYQQQVKQWEKLTGKSVTAPSTGGSHEKAPIADKPPLFAFCLKPRGLAVPHKGSKHRPHKKYSISLNNHLLFGDHNSPHSLGRRVNGLSYGDERIMFPSNGHDSSDVSPSLHASTRVFTPRDDVGHGGYFSLNGNPSDEWNHHPRFNRQNSKKITSLSSPSNSNMMASFNQQRTNGKRNGVHLRNMDVPDHQKQPEPCYRHQIEQLGGPDLDEFRLRDASGAAKHALNMAKLKRERAQKLLYRADLAIHKAVSALLTAEAIKASYGDDSNGDEVAKVKLSLT